MNVISGTEAILAFSGVSVEFGGVKALANVSFSVPKGQICGVIGPNGAGKTTLFNTVSRLQRVTRGTVSVNGRDLSAYAPHDLPQLGVARTFQHVGLFSSMPVFDNVMVGAAAPWAAKWTTRYLGFPPSPRIERRIREQTELMLERLNLNELSDKRTDELPFGSAKRVELARALAAKPQLLMLDEPAGGLTQEEVLGFGEFIAEVAKEMQITVVIVEHNMGLVSSLCDRLVVLDHGEIVADGNVAETFASEAVQNAYFGTGS